MQREQLINKGKETPARITGQEVSNLVSNISTVEADICRDIYLTLGSIAQSQPSLINIHLSTLTEQLYEESGSDSRIPRWNLIEALGDIGGASSKAARKLFPELVDILENETESEKKRAAESIGKAAYAAPRSAESAVEPLIEHLNSDSMSVRANAARALGRIGRSNPSLADDVEKPLATVLHDEKHNPKVAAAEGLQRIATVSPSAVVDEIAELTTALDDNEWTVQTHAAEALGYIGQAKTEAVLDAIPELATIVDSRFEDDKVRGECAISLGRIADGQLSLQNGRLAGDDIIGPIESALQTDHDLFKRKLCKSIKLIARQQPAAVSGSVPRLVEVVEQEGFKMSAEAIRALRNIGYHTQYLSTSDIRSIRNGLESEKPRIRIHSAAALVWIEGPLTVSDEQLSIISESLAHSKDAVRTRAIKSLYNLADPYPDFVSDYQEEILELLTDDYSHVQKYASQTAGRLALSDAETELKELTNHRYPWVRGAAADALYLLNPSVSASPFPDDRTAESTRSCTECGLDISEYGTVNFCPSCGTSL